MQRQLAYAKQEIRNDVLSLSSKGISLLDLFARFGSTLYRAQIFQAEDYLKSLESNEERQLFDGVNEDLIAEYRRKGFVDAYQKKQDRQDEMKRIVGGQDAYRDVKQ